MSSLQEIFPYTPKTNFGIKKQDRSEIDRMASINRRDSENNDQFIRIISQQSLTQEQIEKGKKAREFEVKFDLLSEVYQFHDVLEVKRFLLKNKFLFATLSEIPNQIYNYFGEGQEISLKVSFEPESIGISELWVEILTTLSAQEAMPVLDEFDEHWWHENMNKVAGRLNITLKFV